MDDSAVKLHKVSRLRGKGQMNSLLSECVADILVEITRTALGHHPRLPFQNTDDISFNYTSPTVEACV